MADFTGMMKHVGVLTNTGKNVVVVYMTLPGDENHSLVVDVDALPDTFNDSLRRIVESTEGQQAKNLGDVLGRRPSPDGTQMSILQKFHSAQRLHKVPVELVSMVPKPGMKVPLREILNAMASQEKETPDGFEDLDPETKAAVLADLQKFNVHASNMTNENSANTKEQAIGLLKQAELLEKESQTLRMRAYKMNPELMPKVKKTVKKVKDTTTESNDSTTSA